MDDSAQAGILSKPGSDTPALITFAKVALSNEIYGGAEH